MYDRILASEIAQSSDAEVHSNHDGPLRALGEFGHPKKVAQDSAVEKIACSQRFHQSGSGPLEFWVHREGLLKVVQGFLGFILF